MGSAFLAHEGTGSGAGAVQTLSDPRPDSAALCKPALVYVQITGFTFANGSNFCSSDQRAAAQQDHLLQRCVWIKG